MREFGKEYDVCPYCGYIVDTPAASKKHLAPGTVLQDRYTLGRVLGQGGFGITYIAWDDNLGRAVAVKEYMPNTFATRATGEKEISSKAIGELVMKKLAGLDDVAYVRFASVYREFKDVETFLREIEKLVKKP